MMFLYSTKQLFLIIFDTAELFNLLYYSIFNSYGVLYKYVLFLFYLAVILPAILYNSVLFHILQFILFSFLIYSIANQD